MTMSAKSAELAHALLDLAYAQDVQRATGDQEGRATEAAMQRLYDVGFFDLTQNEQGFTVVNTQPIIEGMAGPLYWLLGELATCANLSLEDVMAPLREWIDGQADQQRSSTP